MFYRLTASEWKLDDSALCVIDRQEGAVDTLLALGITLLSLLKRSDFL